MTKIRITIAVVLIAVGIAGFAYQAVRFMTVERATSIDSPAIRSEPHRMPLPPIIGLVTLIAGIALLLLDDGDAHGRTQRLQQTDRLR